MAEECGIRATQWYSMIFPSLLPPPWPHPHGKVTFMIRVAALVGGVHVGMLQTQSFYTFPSFRNISFTPHRGAEVKTLGLEFRCAKEGLLGEFK